MPSDLKRITFTEEYLPAVQGFYCGNEEWEREAAAWIQGGAGGVIDDMRRGCEVWLYVTDKAGIIGFGSLAPSRWPWPLPSAPAVPINIIPMVGIQQQFWGQPDGVGPAERYSAQILDHLIYEAQRRSDRKPLVGLFVHPNNIRAKRFYEREGFTPFHKQFRDPETGVVYESVLLDLPPLN